MFAGDIVKAKKPAPDIYNYAAAKLGLSPGDCVVVEDSRNGLLAATAAGMACIITQNALTEREDFSRSRARGGQSRRSGTAGASDRQSIGGAAGTQMFTVTDLEAVLAGTAYRRGVN